MNTRTRDDVIDLRDGFQPPDPPDVPAAMSVAADGYRARLADYAERTRALYGA